MQQIPVFIVTGFLGSGKTTLLNWILSVEKMQNSAVIINEFGDISLDHLLVEGSDDDIIELAGGCVCCTVRGALIDHLADLLDRRQSGKIAPFERIIIETSGLADPLPILQSVMAHPVLQQALKLHQTITLIDALNAITTLENHREAQMQLALADQVLLTKCDLVSKQDLANLTSFLEQKNPHAIISQCISGKFDTDLFLASNHVFLPKPILETEQKHHHHSHDHAIVSVSLSHEKPLTRATFMAFIDHVMNHYGGQLLRLKAIAQIQSEPHPILLNGVRGALYPIEKLEKWPFSPKETRIVIIGEGLDKAAIVNIFESLCGTPRLDTPDYQAINDNPLAISGFKI